MQNADLVKMGRLFLLLAMLLIVVALTPGWRRKWGWGRTGDGAPISAVGWLAWIIAFLLISASGFGLLPMQTIFIAPLLIIAAAIFDSLRNRS